MGTPFEFVLATRDCLLLNLRVDPLQRLSSRLFHRGWSDGKGRTLDPNIDVPVTDDRAARLLYAGCG